MLSDSFGCQSIFSCRTVVDFLCACPLGWGGAEPGLGLLLLSFGSVGASRVVLVFFSWSICVNEFLASVRHGAFLRSGLGGCCLLFIDRLGFVLPVLVTFWLVIILVGFLSTSCSGYGVVVRLALIVCLLGVVFRV